MAGLMLVAIVQNVRAMVALGRQQYARVLSDFPMTFAAPAARRAANITGETTSHILSAALSPTYADQLPMRTYPVAGFIMLGLCLIRLGRRNGWAALALGGATIAMTMTLLTWAHYGFAVGRWITPVTNAMSWLLASPTINGLFAMALLSAALGLTLAPYTRPAPVHQPRRTRPDSPNDPRLALEYLGAQRAEGACTNLQYARRRETILARI